MGLYSIIPGFCGGPCAVGAPRIVTTFHPTSNGPDYMHAKHVRIIWTPKSIFAYQYHEF